MFCQLRTEEDDEEDEEAQVEELRFVPSDASHLQHIFMVWSEMSALNPDPAEFEDAGADGGGFFGASDDDDESDDEDIGMIVGEAPDGSRGYGAIGMIGGAWSAGQNDAAMEDADEE